MWWVFCGSQKAAILEGSPQKDRPNWQRYMGVPFCGDPFWSSLTPKIADVRFGFHLKPTKRWFPQTRHNHTLIFQHPGKAGLRLNFHLAPRTSRRAWVLRVGVFQGSIFREPKWPKASSHWLRCPRSPRPDGVPGRLGECSVGPRKASRNCSGAKNWWT